MFWFNRLKIVEHINFCNCCIESRANNIQFLYFFGNTTENGVVGDAEFIPMNIGTKHQQQ
jgi:hypothetical protein